MVTTETQVLPAVVVEDAICSAWTVRLHRHFLPWLWPGEVAKKWVKPTHLPLHPPSALPYSPKESSNEAMA